MKRLLIMSAALLAAVQLYSQSSIDKILSQIEENNTALQSLRSKTDAARAENRLSNKLADPQAEFGYMWGSPSAKKNVSVSQSFDFPSLYASKRDLQALKDNSLEMAYKAQRLEILLTAKQTCLETVYYNALRNLYRRQLNSARLIAEAHKIMLDKGQTNILEYNKAQMNLSNMRAELSRAEAEREALLSSLAAMNGGQPLALEDSVYILPPIVQDFDLWYSSVKEENPALSYLESRVRQAQQEVLVSRRSSLPSFSVGFAGEYVGPEKFSGVTVGLRIPLWENRGRVNVARAEVLSAQKELDDAALQYYMQLKMLHSKAVALEKTVAEYGNLFSVGRGDELLYKACKGGELSLLNYLLEMDYFFSAFEKKLQAEKDLALALASLESFKL